MTNSRPYRGIDAAQRHAQRRRQLLSAGLDILGSSTDPSAVTVRGVCRRAGMTPRYFYESFTDRDDFVAAVFDWVIADITATTQATVSATPPKERNRAGMANVVRIITDDPRVGRLLLSSHEVVVRKRTETGFLLAMLYGNAIAIEESAQRKAVAHFAVGGVTQTINAWLSGDVDLTPDELVDQLAVALDELVLSALRRS